MKRRVVHALQKYLLKARSDDLFAGTPPVGFAYGICGLLALPMRYLFPDAWRMAAWFGALGSFCAIMAVFVIAPDASGAVLMAAYNAISGA